jgi:hypothetical protein
LVPLTDFVVHDHHRQNQRARRQQVVHIDVSETKTVSKSRFQRKSDKIYRSPCCRSPRVHDPCVARYCGAQASHKHRTS